MGAVFFEASEAVGTSDIWRESRSTGRHLDSAVMDGDYERREDLKKLLSALAIDVSKGNDKFCLTG